MPAQSPVGAAVAKIKEGLEELANLDHAGEGTDDLGAALLDVGTVISRLTAQEARLIETFGGRRGFRQDACISTAGWLRLKTNLGPGPSKRRVSRCSLLQRMPALRQAFEAGDVRTEHVDAVQYRAVPRRMDAIAEHDEILMSLARRAEPRDVAVAVQRIVDAVDRDGSEDASPCDSEHLRGVTLREDFAGLGDLSGATTPMLSEVMRRAIDVYDVPDPADTPDDQRRSWEQRCHDALQAALQASLDAHRGATVGGVKTHVVVFVDLFTLLGVDALARIQPRLSSGGGITPALARHLVATSNPTMRAVLGLGPWQPVSVGRVRSLPDWLRSASHLSHVHCRGPGCDLPASRCDSDHLHPYCEGGVTELSNEVPLCHTHNNLKHENGWRVTFDVRTGEVTWTSADGRRVITLPPPDL